MHHRGLETKAKTIAHNKGSVARNVFGLVFLSKLQSLDRVVSLFAICDVWTSQRHDENRISNVAKQLTSVWGADSLHREEESRSWLFL